MNAATTWPQIVGAHRRSGIAPAPASSRREQGSRPPLAGATNEAPLLGLLIEIALLAELYGFDDDASRIGRVVVGLGVERQRFDIARAIAALHRADPTRCLRIVEEDVLAQDPQHELARAVRMLACRRLGHRDWQNQANALMSTSSDSMVRNVVLHGV